MNVATAGAAGLALAGASLIVTRPAGNGAALKRRIEKLGGIALTLPGSRLQVAAESPRLTEELRASYDADRVIFSSPAAVRFASALWPTMRFARGTNVIAVGAATARALSRRGLKNVLRPERQDSEGLLALPQLSAVRGLRIALIGAPGGRDLLPQTLRRRGAQLDAIGVYQRELPRLDRRHFMALEQLTSPCFLLLSSQQTLDNLCRILPSLSLAHLRRAEVIASSARIVVAARDRGFSAITLARSAESGDLLTAAIGALARHRL